MRTLLTAAAAALATLVGATATASSQQPRACTDARIGVLAPLTGEGSFLGSEQLSWARFAIDEFNEQHETDFDVVRADTELTAGAARDAARDLVEDRTVLGVVGASTSAGVATTAPLLAPAQLASVSGSAGRANLTNGAHRNFFRTIASDAHQVAAIMDAVTRKAKARRVTVLSAAGDGTRAHAFGRALESAGVAVEAQAVRAPAPNFAALAQRVPAGTDLVLYVTAAAPHADDLATALVRAGKRIPVFGTDTYSPDLFKPARGYASSPAPDFRIVKAREQVVEDYRDFAGNRTFGVYGPPSFTAAWVLLQAIQTACADGKATRAEVLANVRKTNEPILGTRVRFTPSGELVGARFAVYEIRDGTYRLVQ